MITYKITLENGESQTTQTDKELYCSVLDKFNIKYTIEEINGNDIPHSDIRRMESEGVYEEKFGEPNFSSDSTQYFNEEWNTSSTTNQKVNYQSVDLDNNEYDSYSVDTQEPYVDDEFDY